MYMKICLSNKLTATLDRKYEYEFSIWTEFSYLGDINIIKYGAESVQGQISFKRGHKRKAFIFENVGE